MKNTIKALIFFLLIGLYGQGCLVTTSTKRTTVHRHDNGLHKGWFKSKHKGHKHHGHHWDHPGKKKHKGKHK